MCDVVLAHCKQLGRGLAHKVQSTEATQCRIATALWMNHSIKKLQAPTFLNCWNQLSRFCTEMKDKIMKPVALPPRGERREATPSGVHMKVPQPFAPLQRGLTTASFERSERSFRTLSIDCRICNSMHYNIVHNITQYETI